MFRLTLLEALYTKRRTDPGSPSLYPGELETMLGRPREHLEFTIWYLLQKKHVARDDQSRLYYSRRRGSSGGELSREPDPPSSDRHGRVERQALTR